MARVAVVDDAHTASQRLVLSCELVGFIELNCGRLDTLVSFLRRLLANGHLRDLDLWGVHVVFGRSGFRLVLVLTVHQLIKLFTLVVWLSHALGDRVYTFWLWFFDC